MASGTLPNPPHYDPQTVGEVWKVPYQQRMEDAERWTRDHAIRPASTDRFSISLLLVDVQNTFCVPGFELFVAGRSGNAAVDDNRRLCAFIYGNLHRVTEICPTLDTHQAAQIFHSIFLVDREGRHPPAYSIITLEDILQGVWRFNEKLAASLSIDADYGQEYVRHYVGRLQERGKYNLTIWPFHAMLGGIGHAMVSGVEEAVFFHSICRYSQPDFQVKGTNPLTENYSVLCPEVLKGPSGEEIAHRNVRFIEKLFDVDAVIIAGQAKSHCVAWTVEDLLAEIQLSDKALAEKIYLLEDCSSPVVIPDVIDYTEEADAAFERFSDAGMHIVRSTDPMESWPGIHL